jgi:uncharacterized damage-inducible protein DinB
MSVLPNPVTTSEADRANLLSLLRGSRDRFLQSFQDVNPDQSRRHPGPGQWSVLDTVEHIATAETIMLKLITTTRCPKTGVRPNREEAFLRMVPDRSHKMETPEPGRPTGRFANLAEARTQFEKARAETIRFVQECAEDLRASEVTHPHPAAGVVTTYEMLIVMAMHAERHARQIEEIRQSAAFRAQAGAQG